MISLAIVGTIAKDVIILPDGRKVEGMGGIMYNVLPFLNQTGVEIAIITKAGRDIKDFLLRFCEKFEISTKFIKFSEETNYSCTLHYHSSDTRSEIAENIPSPLMFEDLIPLIEYQWILINFITGKEIHWRELQKFCRNFHGKIYLDYHSLSMDTDSHGKHYYILNPHWREYVTCADYLQLNRNELSTIFPEMLHMEPGSKYDLDEYDSIFSRHEGVFVTDGGNGAFLYENRSWKFCPVPYRVEGNVTGCGDVFGSAAVFSLINSSDAEKALQKAVNIASLSAKGIDFDCTLWLLKEAV
jgi:sugar/nucleoside kinase (ribokinase family)